jgi:serine/threonine protein phosphatase PrpC
MIVRISFFRICISVFIAGLFPYNIMPVKYEISKSPGEGVPFELIPSVWRLIRSRDSESRGASLADLERMGYIESGRVFFCHSKSRRIPADIGVYSRQGMRHRRWGLPNMDCAVVLPELEGGFGNFSAYAVFDGISKAPTGAKDSAAAGRSLSDFLAEQSSSYDNPDSLLKDALVSIKNGVDANFKMLEGTAYFRRMTKKIRRMGGGVAHHPGTTATVALVCGERIHLAHIGDCRAYIIGEREVHKLTEEHKSHGKLSKYVGVWNPEIDPPLNFISSHHYSKSSLGFLLATDGALDFLDEAQIMAHIMRSPPQRAIASICGLGSSMSGDDATAIYMAKKRK